MTRRLNRLQAAFVIARRDYTATVFSRTFLFFLLGPLFPILLGIVFGSMGARMASEEVPPRVAVIATAAEFARLQEARTALSESGAVPRLPDLVQAAPGRSAAQLLRSDNEPVTAVLEQPFTAPRLTGNLDSDNPLAGQTALLLARARTPASPAPDVAIISTRENAAAAQADRSATARAGQALLFLLTLLLSGMLLSQLIEEKSNKVIEVLAAAVPVESIFVGKLFGMLAVSLSGIAVWTTIAVTGLAIAAPGALSALPTPAVGWPLFALLLAAYFAMSYLLIGAAFLGIGAQASTAREVQLLSMPVTMAQVGLVLLAGSAISAPQSGAGVAAVSFPLSSPFGMIARAAMDGALWPHLAALAWQALWIALILKFTAAWFRRSVLKSGRRLWRRRAARPTEVAA